MRNLRFKFTPALPNNILGCLTAIVVYCTVLFVTLLISALAFRFLTTWSIDILSWWRQVLNNLAGAVGA